MCSDNWIDWCDLETWTSFVPEAINIERMPASAHLRMWKVQMFLWSVYRVMCRPRIAVYVAVANRVIYDGWRIIASAATAVHAEV
jgi:hypothetical protein